MTLFFGPLYINICYISYGRKKPKDMEINIYIVDRSINHLPSLETDWRKLGHLAFAIDPVGASFQHNQPSQVRGQRSPSPGVGVCFWDTQHSHAFSQQAVHCRHFCGVRVWHTASIVVWLSVEGQTRYPWALCRRHRSVSVEKGRNSGLSCCLMR